MLGFGKGFDQKKMNALMKQLGISQEELEAERVIIERADGKIIIENPIVTKINVQGQESFQISGEVKEESNLSGENGFSEEDILTVMEKTNASRDEAIKALEKNKGDLAEAILELSS
ncbi:MAG: nascent polypeptide-associated complex protein [Candidatus Pacearchaeota archaeon]|nr:MAG: nascent polypeptide-associated complex protein [Candidatus Pacearchaeota archaeon]